MPTPTTWYPNLLKDEMKQLKPILQAHRGGRVAGPERRQAGLPTPHQDPKRPNTTIPFLRSTSWFIITRIGGAATQPVPRDTVQLRLRGLGRGRRRRRPASLEASMFACQRLSARSSNRVVRGPSHAHSLSCHEPAGPLLEKRATIYS